MKNFEKIRKEKKMTQSDVAKYLKITQATLSSYETERTQPDLDTLIALADLYNVSIDYLLGHNNRGLVIPDEKKETVQQLLALPEKMFIFISGEINAYYQASQLN